MLLQWGRAFVGAEIWTSGVQRLSRTGFNGAAPLWARRSNSGQPELVSPNSLQWGRAFVGAEMPAGAFIEIS